ncbi:hypothetical protein CH371_19840 [Leptospira wolffii]|uniref:Uncharacterized protein n=1 Tax=Leptospira wolffii TaxID=409998 RepID=A0A2M9Z6T6_9LEPT|nr:hypothetical protein [Leptospira wolffii]PJZ64118.1 hypothetical protein CH371_19840 [Leptospira wolffii]
MEILNIAGSIASIVSLILSFFIVSRVYKIKVEVKSDLTQGQKDSKQIIRGTGNKQAGRDING